MRNKNYDFFTYECVEDFFNDYDSWDKLQNVEKCDADKKSKTITLQFKNTDQKNCYMIIRFVRSDTIRFRFNPVKSKPGDFTLYNTRSVVMERIDELMSTMPDFSIEIENQDDKSISVISKNNNENILKLQINFAPFKSTLYKFTDNGLVKILNDGAVPVSYTKVTINAYDKEYENYSIIQAKKIPSDTVSYTGFGEKGGQDLCKNSKNLTYFNFDNMRYSQIYNNWNYVDAEPLYHSNPFFLEFNGNPGVDSVYGIFVDNASPTFMDIGVKNNWEYRYGSMFGDLDYYVFTGKDCKEVLEAFSSVTGHTKLKPRYVLGYHQGGFGYKNRSALEEVIKGYRDSLIPLDGLHIDVDIQYRYRTFTINTENFENPKQMFTEFKKNGIKCSTNITPIISNQGTGYQTYETGLENNSFIIEERYFDYKNYGRSYQQYEGGYKSWLPGDLSDYNPGRSYVGRVYYGAVNGDGRTTTGCYANLYDKEIRQWWGGQYKYLVECGLEMVWQDMTTPAIGYSSGDPDFPRRGDMKSFPFDLMVKDNFIRKYDSVKGIAVSNDNYTKRPVLTVRNLYAYNLHKATYHGLNQLRGSKRNFIIGRGGFSGLHRFAGMWTGDNASTWDFLRINIPQVLAMGISGQPIAGADIGGFEPEKDNEDWADPQLVIRWVLMGTFLPWFRNHYNAGMPGKKKFQELFKFKDKAYSEGVDENYRFWYLAVIPICRHFINLRYRLMQLFYDLMFENTFTGMPISRALFLNFPDDQKLFAENNHWPLYTELFVGSDMLAAPILEKQENGPGGKRDIYLPAGKKGNKWYQFMDNTFPLALPVEGGQSIYNYDAGINSFDVYKDDQGKYQYNKNHLPFLVPIFIRESAVIPTIKPEQFVGELNSNGKANPYTLNIYPGRQGEYNMYLDDGESRESAVNNKKLLGYDNPDTKAGNKYRHILIKHKYTNDKTREITTEIIHDGYTPVYEKYFFAAILHDPSETQHGDPVKEISINSIKINPETVTDYSKNEYILENKDGNRWYYNSGIAVTFIKIMDNNKKNTINVIYN